MPHSFRAYILCESLNWGHLEMQSGCHCTFAIQGFGHTLREKRVPKQCPWGTIATNVTLLVKGHSFFLNNHVYKTVPLGHGGTEIVPLRVPNYGQSNSAPRGTVLVPFFSECREYSG